MTSDHRITSGLIHDILDVLERHGYTRGDDQHAGRAIGLIGDLARIYEGSQDQPGHRLPHHGAAVAARLPRTQQPRRRHPHPRRRQHRPRRAGHRRRLQARPRRDVRRLPRPVLPHLPDPPPGRPRLRPDGRPHAPGRRSRPGCTPASPGQIASPSPPPTGRPASDTRPPDTGRTGPAARPPLPSSLTRGRQSGTCRETAEPYDLPFPDHWPPGRPEYVIVVDQLRDWQPGQPPSLAELLEARPARTREPEPDLEAEP